jgi:hypothetical protein
MASKEEIVEAIRGVDARLDALRERILAGGETPLLEGTWRVRDALSHLAARANGVDRVVRRATNPTPPGGAGAPPVSIDDINAGQVEERRDRAVKQLLDEIRDGHAAAAEQLQTLDDELLARMIPQGFRPGDVAVSDMMLRGGPSHDNGHIDQIEAALSQ